jgi:hypothetical protein
MSKKPLYEPKHLPKLSRMIEQKMLRLKEENSGLFKSIKKVFK